LEATRVYITYQWVLPNRKNEIMNDKLKSYRILMKYLKPAKTMRISQFVIASPDLKSNVAMKTELKP
jgi:hypothetical protein